MIFPHNTDLISTKSCLSTYNKHSINPSSNTGLLKLGEK